MSSAGLGEGTTRQNQDSRSRWPSFPAWSYHQRWRTFRDSPGQPARIDSRLDGDSSKKHIEYVHGTPVYRRRGSLLPIAYLNQVLGLKSADRSEAVDHGGRLQAEDRQFGLVVDGINDTQEIVVKPLGKQLKGLTLYAGATIMGDGRVALILDVLGIGQTFGRVLGESVSRRARRSKQKTQAG
jgi:two-component system chemotaxis sensor kinase CheA